jgi:hypothetical protein
MQHFLKSAHRAAWAKVLPPELFEKFDIAMYESGAALHPGFGGEGITAFAHRFKRRDLRLGLVSWPWEPPANNNAEAALSHDSLSGSNRIAQEWIVGRSLPR